jgi:hypothetical protein
MINRRSLFSSFALALASLFAAFGSRRSEVALARYHHHHHHHH